MKHIGAFFFSIAVFALLAIDDSFCQPLPSLVEQPYYIDVNSDNGEVNTLNKKSINLKYQDKTGDEKPLFLQVVSWDGEEIANYSLSKAYGLNYYTISVEDYFDEWNTGEIYRFSFRDGKYFENKLLIKKIDPNKDNLPIPNIVINPLNLDCEGLEGSTVDFYGQISGGKAPYEINWFVLNLDRTQLIYQPQSEKVADEGKTSTIRVDSNPEYCVMLFVVDACGNEAEQMITVTCPKSKIRVNSLFWNPLKPFKRNSKIEKI